MKEPLQKQWKSLCSKYGATEKAIDEVYSEIEKAYSAENRYYHNLHHVYDLLTSAALFKSLIHNYDAVCFAIWFHDIVYNATSSDNETKSADIADQALKYLGVPDEIIMKVTTMILATQNHISFSDGSYSDTNFFLDFDLQILGQDSIKYLEYKKQIREEYSMVPSFLYNLGRKKILRKFLEAEALYKTEEFRVLYEVKARENIQLEIDQL